MFELYILVFSVSGDFEAHVPRTRVFIPSMDPRLGQIQAFLRSLLRPVAKGPFRSRNQEQPLRMDSSDAVDAPNLVVGCSLLQQPCLKLYTSILQPIDERLAKNGRSQEAAAKPLNNIAIL